MFDQSGFDKKARFMVYFFFSVTKNKKRVRDALTAHSAEFQTMAWYDPVFKFVSTKVVQYTTNEQAVTNNEVFAAPFISPTPPRIGHADLLHAQHEVHRGHGEEADLLPAQVGRRDAGVEQGGVQVVRYYWDQVVEKTRRKILKEAPMYREDYYNNSAGDAYLLIGQDFKEVLTATMGYTRNILQTYLNTTFTRGA